ncbi:hypothetical protein PoB_002488100 [Plakobranchus ocellatus]|uniref:Uncharacterized protein n=1 Tax=Plakobranchus ocellatus TaxID=259542 RepID=A0AAV3ZGS8_9GAST|nr:hypothetical protein PoB_002488100 [Plakobranchus ocellatus]
MYLSTMNHIWAKQFRHILSLSNQFPGTDLVAFSLSNPVLGLATETQPDPVSNKDNLRNYAICTDNSTANGFTAFWRATNVTNIQSYPMLP